MTGFTVLMLLSSLALVAGRAGPRPVDPTRQEKDIVREIFKDVAAAALPPLPILAGNSWWRSGRAGRAKRAEPVLRGV